MPEAIPEKLITVPDGLITVPFGPYTVGAELVELVELVEPLEPVGLTIAYAPKRTIFAVTLKLSLL